MFKLLFKHLNCLVVRKYEPWEIYLFCYEVGYTISTIPFFIIFLNPCLIIPSPSVTNHLWIVSE